MSKDIMFLYVCQNLDAVKVYQGKTILTPEESKDAVYMPIHRDYVGSFSDRLREKDIKTYYGMCPKCFFEFQEQLKEDSIDRKCEDEVIGNALGDNYLIW